MAGKMNIGAGITLDGEKEFKQALQDIGKNMAVLKSEMGKATAAFDENGNSVESAAAKTEIYNKQIDEQKKKIEVIKDALQNASKEYGENSNKVKDWQIKLNNAEAELSKTESALNGVQDELKETGDSADEAGGKFDKFAGIMGKVGTAVVAGVAAIGTAAAGAATALAGMTVGAAQAADDILTLSTQTGISTDDLQKFQYASGLVDVELTTLTNSMAKQIKSMSSAADGSKTAVEAYDKLGVSVTNADGSMRDGQTVYWEVIDALGGMTNETERDALAMQLLGKSAQELNPLIEAGSGKLQELGAQAEAAGAVMSGDTLNAFGAFDDQLQFLQGGVGAAKNALGTVLLPVLSELAGTGTDLLGQFTSGIQAANGDMVKISEVIGETLGSAISTLMEKLPEFLEYGMQIISSVAGAITDNLPTLITAVMQIGTDIVTQLLGALPNILQMGVGVILKLVEGITKALPNLIPIAVRAVLTIAQGLIDNLDEILGAALDIVLALTKGILSSLPELIKALPAIIIGMVKFLVSATPEIISAGVELLTSLVKNLDTIIDSIVLAIPEIVIGITSAFIGNIDKIILAGIDLFTALIENLPVIIVTIVKAIPDIIKALVNGFADNLPKMKDVGTNLITGLWNGIKDAGAWLYDKISGFFGGIVDKIKDFFGIASPSKLFRDQIGKNLALGIGEGFNAGMIGVSSKMLKAIPANISVNGAGGTAKTYNNNPIINIYQPVKSPYAVAMEVKQSMNRLVYGV